MNGINGYELNCAANDERRKLSDHSHSRSFWIVQVAGQEPRTFATRKDALAHAQQYGPGAHISKFCEVDDDAGKHAEANHI